MSLDEKTPSYTLTGELPGTQDIIKGKLIGAQESVKGKLTGIPDMIKGYSAYEVAVINGFKGTEQEWLASLKGEQGKPFEYSDFTPEQLENLRGPQGTPGKPPIVGDNGNWHVWNGAEYIDTGYSATALHNENGGGLVKMWFGTVSEYNALETIYNDVVYHILEGAIPV